PLALYLIATVPFADLWHAFVAFPLGDFRSSFSLPYPPLSASYDLFATQTASLDDAVYALVLGYPYLLWELFWSQIVINGVALAWVSIELLRARMKRCDERDLWPLALVTLFSIALFNQALNRADSLHLLPSGML